MVAFGFNSSSGPLVSFRSASTEPVLQPVSWPDWPRRRGDFSFPGATTSTVPLATLRFLAGSTPGIVNVGITSDLSDPNQGLYFLDLALPPLDLTSSVSVSIRGTGVPEPGTFVLLSTAGAGLLTVATPFGVSSSGNYGTGNASGLTGAPVPPLIFIGAATNSNS